jgi:hypothetical protein
MKSALSPVPTFFPHSAENAEKLVDIFINGIVKR